MTKTMTMTLTMTLKMTMTFRTYKNDKSQHILTSDIIIKSTTSDLEMTKVNRLFTFNKMTDRQTHPNPMG